MIKTAAIMKSILLSSTFLLVHFLLLAQSETDAEKFIEQLINSHRNAYIPIIDSLKAQYTMGDSTVENTIDSLEDVFSDGFPEIYKQVILKFPNAEAAARNIHMFYFDAPFDSLLTYFDKLGPIARNSKSGQHAAAFIERGKKLQPGLVAPSFSQPDTLGRPVNLLDYRGKYVLLEFWASWCVPCRGENPNIKAAYSKYHANGFEVLSISMDKESEKDQWLNAIHEDGLPWQQVSDLKGYDNAVFWQYNVLPIPDNYLIGPDGKIIARKLRGRKLHDILEEIFGN
jgi:peroxiredoxin